MLHTVSLGQSSATSRKRKADEDCDELMWTPSPNVSQHFPQQRPMKKSRSGIAGRPLTLSRLLETLDADSLRGALKSICDSHPSISHEITKFAPRPSVQSALEVLNKYETALRDAFPFGGDSSSDYAYNRVRQHLLALLEALNDFTPHFLPPNETQVAVSLEFLDCATNIVHQLPNWHSFQNNITKQNAYDEITKAWEMVIQEATKKAAGISLRYDGWDKKLTKHNQLSSGRMQPAIEALEYMSFPSSQQARNDDPSQVVQDLLSGTYRPNMSIQIGPAW
jgi:protein Cut8